MSVVCVLKRCSIYVSIILVTDGRLRITFPVGKEMSQSIREINTLKSKGIKKNKLRYLHHRKDRSSA